MKLYKKYYVATKKDSELAYVLPLHGSEANILKQKMKGDSWSRTYDRDIHGCVDGDSIEIENTPTSGYEVIGFSSRYSTSNKHIYLKHPLGFHFEMAIETFVEMLKETNIENGVIQNEMVIYTYKGKNALCVYGGELYNTLEEDGVKFLKITDIKSGDIISLKGKSNLTNKITYLGKYKIFAEAVMKFSEKDFIRSANENRGFYSRDRSEVDCQRTFKTDESEVYLFLSEDRGSLSLFSYKEPSKIKIVSVIGNSVVKNSVVDDLLNHTNTYLYKHLSKENSLYNFRDEVLSEYGTYYNKTYCLFDFDLTKVTGVRVGE